MAHISFLFFIFGSNSSTHQQEGNSEFSKLFISHTLPSYSAYLMLHNLSYSLSPSGVKLYNLCCSNLFDYTTLEAILSNRHERVELTPYFTRIRQHSLHIPSLPRNLFNTYSFIPHVCFSRIPIEFSLTFLFALQYLRLCRVIN